MMREERLILAVIVLILVATVFPVVPIREGRALLFLCGLMGLRALSWADGWRTVAWLSALAVFLFHRQAEGFPVLIALFLAGEAIELIRSHPRLWRPCLILFAVLAIGEALHGVLQWLSLDPLTCLLAADGVSCAKPLRNDVVGFMGDRNTYGAFLALTTPALLVASSWLWLSVPVIPLALILSVTTAPVVALGAAGVWMVWPLGSLVRWGAVALSLAALIAYTVLVDSPKLGRLAAWQHGILAAQHHLWMGHGLGSWSAAKLYDVRTHEVWAQAHNEYVQWLYETGLIGLAAFGAYFTNLARCLSRLRPSHGIRCVQAVLLIAAVLATFHFIAQLAMTAVVLIVVLGVAEGVVGQQGRWHEEGVCV